MEEKDKHFTTDPEVNYVFKDNKVLGKKTFYEWVKAIQEEKETVKYKVNPEELKEKCQDCGNTEYSACLRNNCKNRGDCFVPGFGFNPPIRGRIIDYETKGVKHNQHKLPMSKLFKQFPRALQAVVLTSCYGHNKYNKNGEDEDWLNFSRVSGGSEAYKDAGIRHQLEEDINDSESNLPHVFHELFNKMAECELWIKENDIDIKEMAAEYLKN